MTKSKQTSSVLCSDKKRPNRLPSPPAAAGCSVPILMDIMQPAATVLRRGPTNEDDDGAEALPADDPPPHPREWVLEPHRQRGDEAHRGRGGEGRQGGGEGAGGEGGRPQHAGVHRQGEEGRRRRRGLHARAVAASAALLTAASHPAAAQG